MAHRMKSEHMLVRGTELHWRERGEGRPMVFLHGLADSHLSWLPLAEAFPGRRLVLVDLPGHGRSGRPDAPYTPEWYGEILSAWWDTQGFEDAHLLGHSFGGALAQQLLLSHSERISTVTLVAPGGFGPEAGITLKLLTLPGAQTVLGPLLGVGTRAFMRGLPGVTNARADLAGWFASRPGSARAMVRTVRSVIDWSGQTRDVRERAHELPSLPPTAMLWGDRDPILPVRQAHRAARWLDGLELRLYSGVGHFPQLERTKAVASDLSELLEREERKRVCVSLERVPEERLGFWRRASRWIRRRVARARTRRRAYRPASGESRRMTT